MSTTALNMLDTLRAHLAGFDVPDLASLHLTTARLHSRVIVQLTGREPATITAGLLAWADTLTGVTAAVWRVTTGESVHLSITGKLPTGVVIEIYGATPHTDTGIGADLAPGNWAAVSLTQVRAWTTPGQVTA